MRYRNLDLHSESDVEQKFILPLLKNPVPLGLGYDACDFRTKADIRKLVIDKGRSRKRYFPDYAIIISGLPIAIVEAKSPKESLDEALREARLYATELNSLYPQKINPCTRIIATNGIDLVCGLWDQAEPIVNMKVHDITETSISYADLLDLIEKRKAVTLAKEILRLVRKTADYVKPVRLLGGKSVANESVGENSFGANISVEYKYLFNPDESKDRNAIATNAYVPSKRRQSHVSPIDKIIRASTPLSIVDSLPLSDTIAPTELFTSLRDQERS